MTIDITGFSKAFTSEDVLRKQISQILSKIKGNAGVEITHGAQEYGKDIIFYSRDGLEDEVLNACVVKNDKISGSVDSQSGARAVLIQVEQALDTPYVNHQGEQRRVGKVFIMSP